MPANWVTVPPGETSTIVVPVPCWFWLLLKLLTSTSPRWSFPVLCLITATPYGLTSPFAGTVEAIVDSVGKCPMNDEGDCACAPAAGAITNAAAATALTVAADARAILWITDMSAPSRMNGPRGDGSR